MYCSKGSAVVWARWHFGANAWWQIVGTELPHWYDRDLYSSVLGVA